MLRRSAVGVRRPPERPDRDAPADVDEPTGPALFFGCLRRIVIAGVLLFLLGLLAFYFVFRVGGPLNGAREPAAGASLATSQLTSLRGSHSMGHASLAGELSSGSVIAARRAPRV